MDNPMSSRIVFAVLTLAILLVACGPKEVMPEPRLPVQPVVKAPPLVVETVEAPSTDATVSDIEVATSEVDQLEEEFDFSELDMLDQDLNEIDNLDFE